jgi:ABC-type transport system substrate-binding protein
MTKRRTALLAFAAVFAIIAGACGDSAEPQTSGGGATQSTLGSAGGTVATTRPVTDFDPTAILRYGSMQANSLDPALQKTPCEVTQMRLIYDTLFVYDSSGKLQPMLATEYKLDDPTTLTVKLRSGVKFHDGTAFNAEAVKFALDRALTDPESNIKGTLFMLDSVTAVDETTVRFKMKSPAAGPLLAQLADRAGMMYSPTAFKAAGTAAAFFAQKPVGSGMYKVEGEYRPIESMSVRSWDGYWDTTTPRLGGIDMTEVKVDALVNAIKSPQFDMVPIDAASQVAGLKDAPDVVVKIDPSIQLRTFLINATEKPFDDVKVRQAMAYAIDRKAVTDVMTEGLVGPNNQWYPKGFVGYDAALESLYPYNPDRAKQLLTEAGYPNGFTFNAVIGDTSTSYIQQNELIQAQLKKIGVTMNITFVATAQTVPTFYPTDPTKKSGVVAGAWGANLTLDPDSFFRQRYLSDGNTNVGRDELPGLRDVLAQAAAAADEATRLKLYGQASKLTLDSLLEGFPLFSVPAIQAHKNYVGGIDVATTRCPATLRGKYITKGKTPIKS